MEQQSIPAIDIFEGIIKTDGHTADILFAVQKTGDPYCSEFKIFDSENCVYLQLEKLQCGKAFIIPYRFVELSFVLIKYETVRGARRTLERGESDLKQQFEQEEKKQSADGEEEEKKERSRERTVGEVLQLVRRWRDIFQTSTKGRKSRINLQQAARIIGVSKKSLDDYFLQLRIGEYFDFNFQEHFDQKIGVLRGFIKVKTSKKKKIPIKYPKFLKILQRSLVRRVSPVPKQQSSHVQETKLPLHYLQQKELGQRPKQNLLENTQAFKALEEQSYLMEESAMKTLEDQFFGNFQFLMEEPRDPFFNFDKCMQKRNFGQENPFDHFS